MLDTMRRVACARLRGLRQNDVEKGMKSLTKRWKAFYRVEEVRRPYPQCLTADLNRPAVQRLRTGPQYNRHTYHTLRTGQPNFDKFVTTNLCRDGYQSAFNKINMVHRHHVLVQYLMRRQLHPLGNGKNPREFVGRDCEQ